jgi:hypothetical protein
MLVLNKDVVLGFFSRKYGDLLVAVLLDLVLDKFSKALLEIFWAHDDPRLLDQIGSGSAHPFYQPVRFQEGVARSSVVW